MRSVNMHDAKTNLSRLVAEAAAGEPFIIAKAGKPMVQVVPIAPVEKPVPRRLGFLEGQFKVPEDFDTMYADEIERMFNGDT